VLTITGNSAITDFLATAHPTLGCAARAYDPTGTASVAWNDSGTTSTLDQVYVRTSIGESGAAEAGTTSIRWIAASTTELNSDAPVASTAAWTEVNADESCDASDEICGTPMIVDTVGNTMVAAIVYDSAAGAGVTVSTTYTTYAWDSNDYYYLNDGALATTEAGFEGSYYAGATAGTKGLLNHFADMSGTGYTKADLAGVTYQAIAGNTSVFKLGD
jgi:hypothetical protein